MHTIVDLLLFIALLFLVPISILFPRSHTLHIPDESVVQSARLKDYYSTYWFFSNELTTVDIYYMVKLKQSKPASKQ